MERVMRYSPFFQVLHDETKPVGHFGRGTHYSVLRVPIWHDERLEPLSQGELLDFAIIWDEDHDERVIEPIEEMYFAGLLGPVRFIGERKGTLSVLIDSQSAEWQEKTRRGYHAAINRISQRLDDPWPVMVDQLGGVRGESSIVHGTAADIATYLKHIQLLWKLGRRPAREHLRDQTVKRSESVPEQRGMVLPPMDEDNDIPF
jgi:hypothetical protein